MVMRREEKEEKIEGRGEEEGEEKTFEYYTATFIHCNYLLLQQVCNSPFQYHSSFGGLGIPIRFHVIVHNPIAILQTVGQICQVHPLPHGAVMQKQSLLFVGVQRSPSKYVYITD